MGFKLAVLSRNQVRLMEDLTTKFEELPYEFIDLGEFDSKDKLESFWQENTPNIVMSLPSFSKEEGESEQCLDSAYMSQLAWLAERCAKDDTPLIHLSSYRVFGFDSELNLIDETAIPNGVSGVENTLLDMELLLKQVPRHLILRTSWVVDQELTGLLDIILPRLLEHDESLVVSDHNYGSPVYSWSIADALIAIVQQILCGADNWGYFHFHSSDRCSEAEYVDNLVRVLQSDFEQAVVMPEVAGVDDDRRLITGEASLVGQRCTDGFGIQLLSWRIGLKSELRRWLEANKQNESQG